MQKKLYQQGDVLITTGDKLPANCVKVAPHARGFVLAEGEVTGHAHVIDTLDACEMWKCNDTNELWMNIAEPVTVKHEEHKAITIPSGTYKIGIVREVDPFEKAVQKVRD